jgi:hypothetical protein
MVIGREAPTEIYPTIARWIETHAGAQPARADEPARPQLPS